MTINLQKPDITELKPRITVFGVGGGGGNAVNNMISSGLEGVEFVVANTDSQALHTSKAERIIQMGVDVTEGLGAGSQPDIGHAAAEECIDEIRDHLSGTHMAFVTAGMGGGTGTGAAPVVARAARELGILTVGVVTKPFGFEGARRMKTAEDGIDRLQEAVDTLIVIPNQNLFRVANEKTTLADAFAMADQVLYSGVACITDLMVKEGLINLDFADVRSVMREMGKAMMGTGEASGDGRAMNAAEAAIANPLLDETSMSGAQGLLISITGGHDMTLFEVDEAATRIREEVDQDANIILGATFDESLEGIIRVSVVATGIDTETGAQSVPNDHRFREAAERLRETARLRSTGVATAATAPAVALKQRELETDIAVAQAPAAVAGAVPFQPEAAASGASISHDEFRSELESEIIAPEIVRQQPAAKTAATPDAVSSQDESPAPMPDVSPPRMPKAEDFPHMAQNDTKSGAQSHEERGPMGLLKRLATGLGGAAGSEDSEQKKAEPAASAPRRAEPAQAAPVVRTDDNPYAPPRSGTLDVHGRAATPSRPAGEDDQLDIPAFLRRQAN